jgi:hypothetical protein
MFRDFKELLQCFRDHDVKYLIVGGYAVSFHSQPRATKDLDLFLQASLDNAKAAYAARVAFGAPMEGICVEDLANPEKFIRFGSPPVAVDLMPGVDGVDFDDVWPRRVEGLIDPQSGLMGLFIGRADLLAAKKAAGRARDLADVEEFVKTARGHRGPSGVALVGALRQD